MHADLHLQARQQLKLQTHAEPLLITYRHIKYNPPKTELTILSPDTLLPWNRCLGEWHCHLPGQRPRSQPTPLSPLIPPPVIIEGCQFCLLNISGLSPSLSHTKPLLSAASLLPRHLSLQEWPEQNFSNATHSL